MKKIKEKTAEEIYEEIVKRCNAKGQRSIENVKKMCDWCEENNVSITIRKVGELLEDNSLIPKKQTLRNNKDINRYVKVRSKMQSVSYNKLEENNLDIDYYKNENRILKELLAKYSI